MLLNLIIRTKIECFWYSAIHWHFLNWNFYMIVISFENKFSRIVLRIFPQNTWHPGFHVSGIGLYHFKLKINEFSCMLTLRYNKTSKTFLAPRHLSTQLIDQKTSGLSHNIDVLSFMWSIPSSSSTPSWHYQMYAMIAPGCIWITSIILYHTITVILDQGCLHGLPFYFPS